MVSFKLLLSSSLQCSLIHKIFGVYSHGKVPFLWSKVVGILSGMVDHTVGRLYLPIQSVGGHHIRLDCPVSEVGELSQPFLTSFPLVVHVF